MKQAELRKQTTDSISADQVRDHLITHPEFFTENEDLLEILSVPHPTGAAVSLIERQLAIYRENNQTIQQQLKNLVQIARDNEKLFQKMHQLTVVLMESADLESAVAGVQSVLHEHFKADFVSLRILDKHTSPALSDLFVASDDERLKAFSKILDNNRPKCGRLNADQVEFLFGSNTKQVRSGTIIPFTIRDKTKGLLGIGSANKTRFQPSMGHIFLIRIGELLGLRFSTLLDNPS